MKLFRKWLKEKPHDKKTDHQSRQSGIQPARSSASATSDEYDEDSSFNWLGVDHDYGSIPDTLRGTDDENSSTDTVTVRTLGITEESSYTVEGDGGVDDTVPVRTLTLCESPASTEKDDTGIDPYNSSRFEASG